MGTKIGYVPNARVKAASPLQTLSSKRNWDRLQIKGSSGQLRHQVFNLPIESKVKGKYLKLLLEMENTLLETVEVQWRKGKALVRKTVEAEFLDYPPKAK